MWHGRTDERTDGHKNFWSLTFVSMTHVSIMTLRYIVSEIHTDRQAKYIYRYMYIGLKNHTLVISKHVYNHKSKNISPTELVLGLNEI